MTGINYHHEYLLPEERELLERPISDKCRMLLSPWIVQCLTIELIQMHWRLANPADSGFKFTQRYSPDPAKTQVHIGEAYRWNSVTSDVRPAIFVSRDAAQYKYPTLSKKDYGDTKESVLHSLALVNMTLNVSCVAQNIGMAEAVADFTRQPFIFFNPELAHDFKMRQFSLMAVGSPQPVMDKKDDTIVPIQIQAAFDEGAEIRGDDLKIKTAAHYLFANLMDPPV